MTQGFIGQITDTTTESGNDLAARLNAFDAAHKTNQAGATRPAGIAGGGTWTRDNGDGTFTLMLYDGTTDVELVDDATAAEFLAATTGKVLVSDAVWSAATEVSWGTTSGTLAFNMASGLNFGVTLSGNGTLANPTNVKPGQTGYIRVVQDATGGRTLAFGSNYVFAGGSGPEITTTANAETLLFYVALSSTKILISALLDVKAA
jgi:hypothetical protein